MDFDYKKEARKIIDLLKQDFTSTSGYFFLERRGNIIVSNHIFPDLGDFLPFFLYFGEDDFITSQINLLKKILKDERLISEFSSFGIKNLVKSYEYSDLILGLYDYYLYSGTNENHNFLLKNIEIIIKSFNFNKNLSSFYLPKYKIHFPVVDTRDGTFIEIFAELYVLEKDKKYLDIAENIYRQLKLSSFYKKNKLFPIYIPTNLFASVLRSNKFKSVAICKNNTNTLFGLLSLYSIVQDEDVLVDIYNIIFEIKKVAMVDGFGVIQNPLREENYATLTASFPLIDFLCDFYMTIKDQEMLILAEKIALYWIKLQGKTGLFPLYSNGIESFLDSETDMYIALYKLHEITGNEKYKESAEKCLDGIIRFHGANNYVLGVNIDSGDVLNSTQRTKFIALFLKALILGIELQKGSKIYENKKLFNLMKDR